MREKKVLQIVFEKCIFYFQIIESYKLKSIGRGREG